MNAAAPVEGTVEVGDGRRLGYAQFGPSDGRPVFFFHCSPGSRLQCPDAEAPARLGLCLVTVDRPGYGLSDPSPGRRLTDWPTDVDLLADHLGIAEFAVLGWSGGAPHALACAAAAPERLSAVGVVACPAPFEKCPAKLEVDPLRASLHEAVKADRLDTEKAVARFFARYGEDPDSWYQEQLAESPDQSVVGRSDWDANFRASVAEGFRTGVAGYAGDAVATVGPWGFSPREVSLPICLWQGANDLLVARHEFDYLLSALPDPRPFFWHDEAHGIAYTRFVEILRSLTEHSVTPR